MWVFSLLPVTQIQNLPLQYLKRYIGCKNRLQTHCQAYRERVQGWMSKPLAQPVGPSDYSACVAGEISRASTFVWGRNSLPRGDFFCKWIQKSSYVPTYIHGVELDRREFWSSLAWESRQLHRLRFYVSLTLSLDSSQVSFNSELAWNSQSLSVEFATRGEGYNAG